ncbi:MAG: hypothetical protein ABI333_10515 [bacterium]
MSGKFLVGTACAALLVAPSACSDNTGGPGGESVPFESYCDEWVAMACEVAAACDCLDGYSEALCRTYLITDCRDEVEAPVNAGRMAFDPQAAGQCIQQQWEIAHDCDLTGADWPQACDDMLVGQVPAGQYCDSDSECLTPLECYNDSCVDLPGEGQACLQGSCETDHFCGVDDLCHRYRAQGQPCPEGDYACDDDLYCDSRTDTCEHYLASQADCSHASWACDDDLYCSMASQVCRPYPTAGLDCDDSEGECAEDLYCDEGYVCRLQQGAGAVCAQDQECLSWDCIDNLCEPDSENICLF